MTPCDHLKPGSWPLRIDHVFDAELSFADALASCGTCGQSYLLELLDRRDTQRLFRISHADEALALELLRNFARGSCDVQRASAEFENFRNRCPRYPAVLWIDTSGPRVQSLVRYDGSLPGESWRNLALNGDWFRQLDLSAAHRARV